MALVRNYQKTETLIFSDDILFNYVKKNCLPTMNQRILGEIHSANLQNPQFPTIEEKLISDTVGLGVFAQEEIPVDAFIGEYTGVVRRSSILHPLNDYSFKYPINDSIGRTLEINAQEWGNFTRHINHSYEPNLDALIAFHDGIYRAIFVAIRPIEPGEQLTYNYGENYWSLRGNPLTF